MDPLLSLPTIATVIIAALIDSINPCAIGVMILLVGLMISNSKLRKKMLFYGGLYIGAVFITYLAAGLGLMYFFAIVPLWMSEYISIFVGLIIIGAGIIEIKDFFWYGKGISLSIPPDKAKEIQRRLTNISIWGVLALGVFVAAVELPCTGGPYLAVILLLSQDFTLIAFLLLVIYNIIFIAPLLVVLGLAVFGTKIQDMKQWKQGARPYMRLAIGALLVALGWMLMLIANGTINLA